MKRRIEQLGWVLLLMVAFMLGPLLRPLLPQVLINGIATGGFNPYISNTYYSVAGTAIPACSSTYAHQLAWVKDETTACAVGNTYAGSGSPAHVCVAQCDGTSTWFLTGVPGYGS